MAFGGRGTLVFVVKKVVSLMGNCSLGTDVLGSGLKRKNKINHDKYRQILKHWRFNAMTYSPFNITWKDVYATQQHCENIFKVEFVKNLPP